VTYYPPSADERREAEALRLITLVQDGPQRLRLVRFSAEPAAGGPLVSGRFAMPADAPEAQPELEKTLRALAARISRCTPTRRRRPGR
jgi:hypothetical protein